MKLQGSRFVGCIGGSWRDCTFCPFFWYPLRSGGMDFRAGCPFHLFFRYTLRSGGKSDVDCWRNGISFLLTFSVSPSFRCGGIPFLKRGPPLTDGTCSDPHSGWHRPDTEGALLRPGGKHQAGVAPGARISMIPGASTSSIGLIPTARHTSEPANNIPPERRGYCKNKVEAMFRQCSDGPETQATQMRPRIQGIPVTQIFFYAHGKPATRIPPRTRGIPMTHISS